MIFYDFWKKYFNLEHSLERKIKAVEAAKQVETVKKEDHEPLPGTNVHADSGANPIWDPEEAPKVNNGKNPLYREANDAESSEDDDGDEIFIGVEDQDDFKGYQNRYDDETSSSSMSDDYHPPYVFQKESEDIDESEL